jgi:hypothetical protein
MNILIWTAAEGQGPFQRRLPDGRIFSDLMTAKPVFSFPFVNLRYIEQANEYTIDGRKMTAAEQAEVYNTIQAVEPPLEWLKSMKLAEIMGAYERDVAAILQRPADPFEMASWRKQEEEARAYLANAAAPTPVIDGLRAARAKGEDRATLAQKIVARADAFAASYSPTLGKKQAYLDAIDVATTHAAVDAIVW